jgi:hypothetical protein
MLEREEAMSVTEDEAAEALAQMKDARIRANEMKPLPFVYHIAVGALAGGWVAIQGLPRWWFGIALLLFLGLTWVMYRWQISATSRWVNGFRPGRTLWVAFAMTAAMVGFILTSNPHHLPTFALFTPVQGGLMTFVAVTFLDWLWIKIYDAELRSAR